MSFCCFSKKPCKHFDQGRGVCPFGASCFYLHTNPDGTEASRQLQQPRKCQNADGDCTIVSNIRLWDFLEQRTNNVRAFIEDNTRNFLQENIEENTSDDIYVVTTDVISEDIPGVAIEVIATEGSSLNVISEVTTDSPNDISEVTYNVEYK